MLRRLRPLRTACWSFAALVVASAAAAHPLDPLSGLEIKTAVGVLRAAGLADEATRFALIDLDEPDKAEVLGWRPGQQSVRKAFVIARRDRRVAEAVVDLGARKVERWDAIPGVQSAFSSAEWDRARRIVTDDAGWRRAMRTRGYTGFDRLYCEPRSAGDDTDPTAAGRRVVWVSCFDTRGTSNIRARPIEGLVAVVDLDAGRVLRLIDSGPVPVSRGTGEFGERPYPRAQPARPPAAAGFAVDGYRVRWRGWSFRYRMDRRVGLIVSLVKHQDAGRRRLVLYRGSVAEMFVPYMTGSAGWSFRAALDVGEYGFGWLSSPLVAGADCPAGATMLDAVLPDDAGRPVAARSVACLFEHPTARPLWRHAESASGRYAGRPERELVLRSIPSVGNYDYVIDWVLTEAGTIRVDVGATGIDAVKGVAARNMTDPSAAPDAADGRLVAPNLVAVDHDHFLSLRLDLDIDGADNTLLRERLVPQRSSGKSEPRNAWTVVHEPIETEGPLGDAGLARPEVWRVVNPNVSNSLGEHPGYELRPGPTATSLPASDDLAPGSAAFATAPLWITAYDRGELYAAGTYPNRSRDGGLKAFAAHHRRVKNADIVLWYTMGFHHLPRPEDWPVMTTLWNSVSLVPYGFFDRNPSLDPAPDGHR